MTELSVEGLNLLRKTIHEVEDEKVSYKLQNSGITTMIRTNSSNADNEEFIMQSLYRSSDASLINRNNVIKFEKTGELLKKMKRQLSTQALQKVSNKNSSKINDQLNTQYSCNQLHTSECMTKWQKLQKDQMTEAIMDEYQKQILRLKAELDDLKEEKKQVKSTLQKQRKFYMTEMYNKELIIEEIDFQTEKLRGQIEKHVNLQYQFQEKIRLLEIQNAEYSNQLEGWMNSSRKNSQEMSPIHEQSEDFCGNSTGISRKSRRRSNKMFMSLNNGFANENSLMDEDPFDIMRLAHEREIQKYEKELKSIKEFYENKLKAYRKSLTPKKGNQKNAIHIVDEYVCSDTISCQSQSRPQNLKNILRQQFAQGRSSKKVDDTTSFATAKYFMYPINSKKNLNGQDFCVRENDCEEFELKYVDMVNDESDEKESKLNRFIWRYLPSKQFMKGFGVGTVASGILALAVYRSVNNK